MAKKPVAPKEDFSATTQENGFPVPLTEDEFHRDVVSLFLHQLRQVAWMTDCNKAWLIPGQAPADPSSLFDPEFCNAAAAADLAYAGIRETPFAQYLENMYQYAYFGVLDESMEPIG